MAPHNHLPVLRSLAKNIGFELQVDPGSTGWDDYIDVMDDDKGIIVMPVTVGQADRDAVKGLMALRFV